jgi:RNA polymerase sigma-70 factor (ECF subfamily)
MVALYYIGLRTVKHASGTGSERALRLKDELRALGSRYLGRTARCLERARALSEGLGDLLDRCRGGDESAWHELVARHTRRVFALCYRFTGRAEEAEDLTQEVFVKVFEHLDRYREGEGAFAGWLLTLARRHAIDHYRRHREERRRRIDEDAGEETAAEGEGPHGELAREERREIVRRGLRALPHELREVLVLRDLEEMTYQEIAELTGLPLGTVKSRINRGRVELARRLVGRLGTASLS